MHARNNVGAIKKPHGQQLARRIMAYFPGRNQSQVASLIGVPPQYISSWLRGELVPSLASLEKFVAATGASWDWLITGQGKVSHKIPASQTQAEIMAQFRLIDTQISTHIEHIQRCHGELKHLLWRLERDLSKHSKSTGEI